VSTRLPGNLEMKVSRIASASAADLAGAGARRASPALAASTSAAAAAANRKSRILSAQGLGASRIGSTQPSSGPSTSLSSTSTSAAAAAAALPSASLSGRKTPGEKGLSPLRPVSGGGGVNNRGRSAGSANSGLSILSSRPTRPAGGAIDSSEPKLGSKLPLLDVGNADADVTDEEAKGFSYSEPAIEYNWDPTKFALPKPTARTVNASDTDLVSVRLDGDIKSKILKDILHQSAFEQTSDSPIPSGRREDLFKLTSPATHQQPSNSSSNTAKADESNGQSSPSSSQDPDPEESVEAQISRLILTDSKLREALKAVKPPVQVVSTIPPPASSDATYPTSPRSSRGAGGREETTFSDIDPHELGPNLLANEDVVRSLVTVESDDAKYAKVVRLDLSLRMLNQLPKACVSPQFGLTHLILTSNKLTSLPAEFIELAPTLKFLSLAWNAFAEIPSVLRHMQCLKELDLSFNQLSGDFDPQGILTRGPARLTLESLFVTDNKISRLSGLDPDKRPVFPNLRMIDFSFNQITSVHESWFVEEYVPALHTISLTGNELVNPPKDIAYGGLFLLREWHTNQSKASKSKSSSRAERQQAEPKSTESTPSSPTTSSDSDEKRPANRLLKDLLEADPGLIEEAKSAGLATEDFLAFLGWKPGKGKQRRTQPSSTPSNSNAAKSNATGHSFEPPRVTVSSATDDLMNETKVNLPYQNREKMAGCMTKEEEQVPTNNPRELEFQLRMRRIAELMSDDPEEIEANYKRLIEDDDDGSELELSTRGKSGAQQTPKGMSTVNRSATQYQRASSSNPSSNAHSDRPLHPSAGLSQSKRIDQAPPIREPSSRAAASPAASQTAPSVGTNTKKNGSSGQGAPYFDRVPAVTRRTTPTNGSRGLAVTSTSMGRKGSAETKENATQLLIKGLLEEFSPSRDGSVPTHEQAAAAATSNRLSTRAHRPTSATRTSDARDEQKVSPTSNRITGASARPRISRDDSLTSIVDRILVELGDTKELDELDEGSGQVSTEVLELLKQRGNWQLAAELEAQLEATSRKPDDDDAKQTAELRADEQRAANSLAATAAFRASLRRMRNSRNNPEEPVSKSTKPQLPALSPEEVAKRNAFYAFMEGCPETFLCPITYQAMYDPVVAADGHTYEREAIEKWFLKKSRSPMTGEDLTSKVLTPNLVLKSAIQAYVTKALKERGLSEIPLVTPLVKDDSQSVDSIERQHDDDRDEAGANSAQQQQQRFTIEEQRRYQKRQLLEKNPIPELDEDGELVYYV